MESTKVAFKLHLFLQLGQNKKNLIKNTRAENSRKKGAMGVGKEGIWKKRPWDEDTHEKAGNLSLSRRHHTGVKSL